MLADSLCTLCFYKRVRIKLERKKVENEEVGIWKTRFRVIAGRKTNSFRGWMMCWHDVDMVFDAVKETRWKYRSEDLEQDWTRNERFWIHKARNWGRQEETQKKREEQRSVNSSMSSPEQVVNISKLSVTIGWNSQAEGFGRLMSRFGGATEKNKVRDFWTAEIICVNVL